MTRHDAVTGAQVNPAPSLLMARSVVPGSLLLYRE